MRKVTRNNTKATDYRKVCSSLLLLTLSKQPKCHFENQQNFKSFQPSFQKEKFLEMILVP